MRQWGLIAIVALTILCRGAYVVPIRQAQLANPIRGAEMELAAISLVEKGELGNVYCEPTGPTAHLSPLYALLLAAVYAIIGHDTFAALLAQSFLAIGAVAVGLACLPWLARRIGLSEAAGWLAAYVLAILPINYWYESFGDWEQPFAGLVLTAMLACFLALRESAWTRPWLVVGVGVLSGLAALLCPYLLPAVALMGFAEFVSTPASRRRVIVAGAVIVTLTSIMVTPWTIRNFYALGGFVPLRSNVGFELSFGNNEKSNGSSNIDWSEEVRHPHSNPTECRRLKEIGELAYMKEKQNEAIEWITANPERFAELIVTRFRIFWFPGLESFNNNSFLTRGKIAFFGSVSFFMFLTLVRMAWIRHPSFSLVFGAILGASSTYLLTHVEIRYRLPVHALSALLAADATIVALDWLRRRQANRQRSSPADSK